MESSEFEKMLNEYLKRFQESKPQRMQRIEKEKKEKREKKKEMENKTLKLDFEPENKIYDAKNPEHLQIVRSRFNELLRDLSKTETPLTLKQINAQYGKR